MTGSFISLLGWNVVIAGILALIVAALGMMPWVKRRPALRHALWLLVLVKLVTPPLIPVPVIDSAQPLTDVAESQPESTEQPVIAMRQPPPEMFQAEMLIGEHSPSAHDASAETRAPETRFIENTGFLNNASNRADLTLPGILLAVWGTVSLLLLGRNWRQVRKTSRLIQRAGPADERLTRIARDAADRMNVTEVDVRVVDARVPPLTWTGWNGTCILFPRQLANQLSDEQVTGIACHELAHHVRRDQWYNMFGLLVTSLFWWHPAAWIACREVRQAQELCCDELVIRSCAVPRQSYLKTLFQTLEFIQTEQAVLPIPASGFGDSRSITSRFKLLAGGHLVHRNNRTWKVVIIAILAGLSCVPTPSEPGDTSATAPPIDSAAAEPVQQADPTVDMLSPDDAAVSETGDEPVIDVASASNAEADDEAKRLYLHWFTPTYYAGEGNPPLLILTLSVTLAQDFDAVSFDPLHDRRECSIEGRIDFATAYMSAKSRRAGATRESTLRANSNLTSQSIRWPWDLRVCTRRRDSCYRTIDRRSRFWNNRRKMTRRKTPTRR